MKSLTGKPQSHTHTDRQTDRQYAVNKFDREKRKKKNLLVIVSIEN
jgi:hypothetical protein